MHGNIGCVGLSINNPNHQPRQWWGSSMDMITHMSVMRFWQVAGERPS